MGKLLDDLNETWNKNAKAPSLEVLQVLNRTRTIVALLDTVNLEAPDELIGNELTKIREAKIQAGVALMYLPDESTHEVAYLKNLLDMILDKSDLICHLRNRR